MGNGPNIEQHFVAQEFPWRGFTDRPRSCRLIFGESENCQGGNSVAEIKTPFLRQFPHCNWDHVQYPQIDDFARGDEKVSKEPKAVENAVNTWISDKPDGTNGKMEDLEGTTRFKLPFQKTISWSRNQTQD